MRINWSAPTDPETVKRRAAGRRAYNALRTFLAGHRRTKVADLLVRYGMGRGVQARIARELNVTPATISRDMKYLMETYRPCPACGSVVHIDQVDRSTLLPPFGLASVQT